MKKILSLLLINLFLISNVYALNLSRVKTWTAEVLTHTDLNAEFNNILDHTIANADVSATAAIVASKLDQSVAGAIGATTPNTGAFTTLSSTGNVTFDSNTLYVDATNNKVGIGTTAPNGMLQVGTSPGAGLTVTAAGNVGIGTTAPSQKLETDGVIKSTIATGTAPLIIASTTKVTNLNSDTLDGYNTATTATASSIYVSGGDNYLPDATVDTTALKTATAEASSTGADALVVLTGGEYSFMCLQKNTGSGKVNFMNDATLDSNGTYRLFAQMYTSSGTVSAQTRYVTASGEDRWIFLLLDKNTKEIISASQGKDAPWYGNGGDQSKVPHPFLSYDETKHEIVLLDKETCQQLEQESEQTGKSILTLVDEDYKPNMSKEETYQPLHSGKFLGREPELVQAIPSYIKVRKLVKLTDTERQQKETKKQQDKQKVEQAEQKKKQNKISAENKLKNMGLTKDEIDSLR